MTNQIHNEFPASDGPADPAFLAMSRSLGATTILAGMTIVPKATVNLPADSYSGLNRDGFEAWLLANGYAVAVGDACAVNGFRCHEHPAADALVDELFERFERSQGYADLAAEYGEYTDSWGLAVALIQAPYPASGSDLEDLDVDSSVRFRAAGVAEGGRECNVFWTFAMPEGGEHEDDSNYDWPDASACRIDTRDADAALARRLAAVALLTSSDVAR